MCGFSASCTAVAGALSAPSPPEVIDVPTNSAPTIAEAGSAKSRLEVAGPVGVHVAGQDDRVGHVALGRCSRDALARADVAVPGVHAEAAGRARSAKSRCGEEDLLGEHVPARRRSARGRRAASAPARSPVIVRRDPRSAQGGSAPSPQAWSSRYWRVSSTLNSRQVAVGQPPVEAHVRPARHATAGAAACARSRPGRRRPARRRNARRVGPEFSGISSA